MNHMENLDPGSLGGADNRPPAHIPDQGAQGTEVVNSGT